jgi:membrane associated rhomboid family serine protease
MPTCYRHPNRETGLSCTECDRPICTECLRMTPVGPRCPDHATTGRPTRRAPVQQRAMRRASFLQTGQPIVTMALIGVNVLVYLITVAQGAGINSPGGSLYDNWALLGGPGVIDGHLYGGVAQGDWWRLLTAAFLHGSILHIGFNMFVLYVVGGAVENFMGAGRYLALYLVSGLAGSAGALVVNPTALTVGASGAIYGIFGALLIIEYSQTGTLAGQAMTLIAINLAISFTIPGISWGGHIGGLIGGILATLAISRFGRGHIAYGRPGIVGIAGLIAVGVASVAVSYWKVRGYA